MNHNIKYAVIVSFNVMMSQQIMKLIEIIVKSVKSALNAIKNNSNKITKLFLVAGLLLILRKVAFAKKGSKEMKIIEQTISAFYEKMGQNNIKNVDILSQSIVYKDISEKIYSAVLPKHAQSLLQAELRKANISFSYKNSIDFTSTILIFLLWAVFGFLFFMFFKADSQGKMDTSSKPVKSTTFADVVGLDECKKSLQEIIDYMKQPKKYEQIGARMRRGIIFYGPSGTGKTTLAKAMAGEAGVPFFSCNASQFCQIYVGVGPKRVKELFARAKQNAPSIIYIDQIDAIGNRKGLGMYNDGAGSEKNSTINQLLSEMDGFSSSDHVLVIASTNRLQMIDSALLRAGRFDLKLKVGLPTEEERFSILTHHFQGKRCTIKEQYLRKQVIEMKNWSGADLQNLANQSVYTALRMGLKEINEQVLNSTLSKMLKQHEASY